MQIQVPKKEMDAMESELLKQEHRNQAVPVLNKKGRCGSETAPAELQTTFIIVAVI